MFRLHGLSQGRIQRGAIEAIASPKSYESNLIHHNFVQFGNKHSRYKAILSSIDLPQQFCEAYLIPLTDSEAVMGLVYQYY